MGLRIVSVSGLRGLVGDGLDPMVATEFAAAYAAECEPGPILVGHDGRVSAHVFEHAVIAGITAAGHDVLRVGPVATPTLGVLVRDRQASGAVQISASHNPPEYNGLKCFQREGMVLSPAQGQAILDRIANQAISWAGVNQLGRVFDLADPEREHLERVLSIVNVEAIRQRGFRVVLDGCHGGGARMGAQLLRRLGCSLTTLGAVADGHYEHTPEPTEENLTVLPAVVRATGSDVGFVQDPDADRLAIIDDQGRYIGEERTFVLAAERRLAEASGPVVANLSTSRMIDLVAAQHGASVIRTPVGEFHVVSALRANGAILGGEGNGGVIDPRVGFVRDSFVAMAVTLDLLAARAEPLSSVVDRQPNLTMVKTKFPAANRGAGLDLERLRAAFPDARFDDRDGLRVDWPDRWVHVRGSNTEPIVRVISEAADRGQALELAESVGRLVASTNS